MPHNDAADNIQFVGIEALVASVRQGFKPEFPGPVLTLHVNVARLGAVGAREKEPMRPSDTRNSRHLRPPLGVVLQAISCPDPPGAFVRASCPLTAVGKVRCSRAFE